MTISRCSVLALVMLTGCTTGERKPRNEIEALMMRSDGREQLPRYVLAHSADPEIGGELIAAGFVPDGGKPKDDCRYFRYHKRIDGLGQTRDAVVWLCGKRSGANLGYTFL